MKMYLAFPLLIAAVKEILERGRVLERERAWERRREVLLESCSMNMSREGS
jgi:hypothetical protein